MAILPGSSFPRTRYSSSTFSGVSVLLKYTFDFISIAFPVFRPVCFNLMSAALSRGLPFRAVCRQILRNFPKRLQSQYTISRGAIPALFCFSVYTLKQAPGQVFFYSALFGCFPDSSPEFARFLFSSCKIIFESPAKILFFFVEILVKAYKNKFVIQISLTKSGF